MKKSCDIVLNVLFVDDEESDTIEIKQGYISKHNLERENQDILLMIMDKLKWYYTSMTKLSELLMK